MFWTLVDEADFDLLRASRWYVYKRDRGTQYALRDRVDEKGTERLHRVLLNAPRGALVDHRNLNGLDNRRENLRLSTTSSNLCNRGATKANKSGFKGVSWSAKDRCWRAVITFQRKWYFLGNFSTPEAAARAYERAALRLHGDFARTGAE